MTSLSDDRHPLTLDAAIAQLEPLLGGADPQLAEVVRYVARMALHHRDWAQRYDVEGREARAATLDLLEGAGVLQWLDDVLPLAHTGEQWDPPETAVGARLDHEGVPAVVARLMAARDDGRLAAFLALPDLGSWAWESGREDAS